VTALCSELNPLLLTPYPLYRCPILSVQGALRCARVNKCFRDLVVGAHHWSMRARAASLLSYPTSLAGTFAASYQLPLHRPNHLPSSITSLHHHPPSIIHDTCVHDLTSSDHLCSVFVGLQRGQPAVDGQPRVRGGHSGMSARHKLAYTRAHSITRNPLPATQSLPLNQAQLFVRRGKE
jgi:hypothetical protein